MKEKRPRRRPARPGRPPLAPEDRRVPFSASVHPETAKWLKSMSDGEPVGHFLDRVVGHLSSGRAALPPSLCRRCGTSLGEEDLVEESADWDGIDVSDPLVEAVRGLMSFVTERGTGHLTRARRVALEELLAQFTHQFGRNTPARTAGGPSEAG